jgi:ATP-dependent protease Clp ATPase subunit
MLRTLPQIIRSIYGRTCFLSSYSNISPREIFDGLSEDIVGQTDVKIAISVGLHNHMLRNMPTFQYAQRDSTLLGGVEHSNSIKLRTGKMVEPVRLDKTNILLLGPTGQWLNKIRQLTPSAYIFFRFW